MTKVYLVVQVDWEFFEIAGVYGTIEDARIAMGKVTPQNTQSSYIEILEFVVGDDSEGTRIDIKGYCYDSQEG